MCRDIYPIRRRGGSEDIKDGDYMCWIINILILCLFGIEIMHECEMIEDAIDIKTKVIYIIRLAFITLLIGFALLLLYKLFGVTDENLLDYIITRRT
jgi:hypothetical protein